MDIFFTQRLESLDVILYVKISVTCARFNVIVNINALYSGDLKSRFSHISLKRLDLIACPELAGFLIVERSDNALDPRYLSDISDRYRVKFFTEPSECHFHKLILPLTACAPRLQAYILLVVILHNTSREIMCSFHLFSCLLGKFPNIHVQPDEFSILFCLLFEHCCDCCIHCNDCNDMLFL